MLSEQYYVVCLSCFQQRKSSISPRTGAKLFEFDRVSNWEVSLIYTLTGNRSFLTYTRKLLLMQEFFLNFRRRPNFTYVFNSRTIGANIDWDNILNDHGGNLKELQDNLLLTYSTENPNIVNTYPLVSHTKLQEDIN